MTHSQQVVLDDALLDYVLAHSTRLPDGLNRAANLAEELGRSTMQISPDQALLLRLLVRISGVRSVLEIGTFLGFSAAVLADAVGPAGRIVCLDRASDWLEHARKLWDEVGLGDRIETRVGDAHETLAAMPDDEVFDLVFVDADKEGYVFYLDEVTPHLRPGGLLLVDNTLWSGRVNDESDTDVSTRALREFNRLLVADERYETTILPMGDGLTVAIRR